MPLAPPSCSEVRPLTPMRAPAVRVWSAPSGDEEACSLPARQTDPIPAGRGQKLLIHLQNVPIPEIL